jgi:hypothetical protein
LNSSRKQNNGLHSKKEVGEVNKKTIATAGALAVLALGLGAPAAVTTLQADDSTALASPSINAPLDDEKFSDLGVLGHRGPRDGVKRPGFGAASDRPIFSPAAEGR